MRVPSMIGVLLAVMLSACGSPAPDLTGEWNGTIDVPGQSLQFGLRFVGDGTGSVDIPAQGARGLPATEVRLDGTAVSFRLGGVPGDASFAGTLEGDSVSGEFTQAGQRFPFTMRRGALVAPTRPQEPKAPFPYRTTEVAFPSGDITIAGTLTQPDGAGPFPAVVMITGSGAQDRDETVLGHKPFLLLADTLTRAGFAVLRTDDRGVGGTGGTLETATYDDLSADVLAGVTFLRGRPDVDATRLGLFGHSEGGYLAPLAAQRGGDQVRFLIVMAGPAVPGEDVLLEQNALIYRAQGASQQAIDTQLTYVREVAALLRAGRVDEAKARTRAAIVIQLDTAGTPADQRPTPEQLDRQVDAVTSPGFAAFLLHDPGPSLRAVRIPVLAFFGEKDLQVPPAQSEPAMRAALAGSPDATVRTLPVLNHFMQPATTGSPAEYGAIETTIDPAALDLVRSWATERFVR